MNNINGEYVKINNANLFCTVTGEGEPLVFIHGNFNDLRIWDYQMDDFTKYYKVIRYDLRGYGKSDTPISSFSNCEDLKLLFDSLHIKNATIIGSSSGGSVAVDFALQYPELVKALVLAAPSINGYRYPLRMTYEAMKSIYLLKLKGFEIAIEKFINNPFWEYFFPPEYRQEAREKVLQTIRTKKNFYSWNFKLAVPIKPYAYSRLSEIQVPVLIVLSDKDKPFNIEVGERVHKEIHNSKKVVINDCAHLPFVEKPKEFNREVMAFLKETLQ